MAPGHVRIRCHLISSVLPCDSQTVLSLASYLVPCYILSVGWVAWIFIKGGLREWPTYHCLPTDNIKTNASPQALQNGIVPRIIMEVMLPLLHPLLALTNVHTSHRHVCSQLIFENPIKLEVLCNLEDVFRIYSRCLRGFWAYLALG